MIKSTQKKVGRPEGYCKVDGKIIPGLRSMGKGSDRWCYYDRDGKRVTFTEPDRRRAVARFIELTTGKKPTVTIPLVTSSNETLEDIQAAGAVLAATISDTGVGQIQLNQIIDELQMFQWMRDMILTQPKRCAQMTGIEQLAYLADMPKPTASPTLKEVCKPYLEKAKITDNWRQKTEVFWEEFCDSVKVTRLRDVTQELVIRYMDEVMEEVSETKSPTFAKHRFGQIKVVLNYARKRGLWSEDITRVLALCAVLIPPKTISMDPMPIDRGDYHKLLAHANPQMRAILLMSLNAVMYGQEVGDLLWKDNLI